MVWKFSGICITVKKMFIISQQKSCLINRCNFRPEISPELIYEWHLGAFLWVSVFNILWILEFYLLHSGGRALTSALFLWHPTSSTRTPGCLLLQSTPTIADYLGPTGCITESTQYLPVPYTTSYCFLSIHGVIRGQLLLSPPSSLQLHWGRSFLISIPHQLAHSLLPLRFVTKLVRMELLVTLKMAKVIQHVFLYFLRLPFPSLCEHKYNFEPVIFI